jgi:alpha-galactosidase
MAVKFKYLFLLSYILFSCNSFAQKRRNLAPTPPMGWNSWNTFQARIDEKLVMETADKMVASGMRDAGYNYLVLDDGWMAKERNKETGNLVADPIKFPRGMKFIADYVHSKGLKFGLYNCAGTLTCAGYPGTRGYEYQDARFYAEIGIDFLKYDWCFTKDINAKEAYRTMSNALSSTGRAIVFSICEWGESKPWEWADSVGHLWRTTPDITLLFDGIKDHGHWNQYSINEILKKQESIRAYNGVDGWNDLDMLEVGNGFSESEDRAHFSMWCMMSSPLMCGNNLLTMSETTKNILTNKGAIAIDQDGKAIPAYKAMEIDSIEVWIKPLSGNEIAYCFFNRAKKPTSITYNWSSNPVNDKLSATIVDFAKTEYSLYNIWQQKNVGTTKSTLVLNIPAHDVMFLRLTAKK